MWRHDLGPQRGELGPVAAVQSRLEIGELLALCGGRDALADLRAGIEASNKLSNKRRVACPMNTRPGVL